MAERSASLACKKFSANVFDKNKCQDCFKTKDAHHDSTTTRPTSLEIGANRPRTTVKSGILAIATQVSTLPKVQVQKWENVWFMLYSSGILEWFTSEVTQPGQTSLGSISLDDCTGLTSAEVDTNEPFSIGIKTSPKTHYLKAENRLEMDNWCRVLKPFVIASPGYKYNRQSPTTRRAFSYQDSKNNSPNNVPERKSSLSRTVSAPWQAATDQKNTSGTAVNNVAKKRWSATEELLTKREMTDNSDGITSEGTETAVPAEKQIETRPESDPRLQPYFSDIYLTPEPSEEKLNGETSNATSRLESELAEAKRVAKLNEGKAEMCSKNLAGAKKQLEKANNIISIKKANIEALTSEVETLKTRLKHSDEVLERRLAELESRYPTCNGSTSRDSIESGFIKLQAKLQENEKALIGRTRELEKANESRKKVAKHTRALLIELEEKLTENNCRINELEEQLMNKTLDLQYEKEERKRIQQLTKELSASNLHSKQREITKRSTELLQQAKKDHRLSKNEQKSQQEIESLNKKLQTKNFEIERLQERLDSCDKKDGEVQKLEAAYKEANEQLDSLRSELGLVNESYDKEKARCNQLESQVQDISVKITERERKTKEIQDENVKLKGEVERARKECETQILLLQEDNETTRTKLHEVQEELDAFHTETDGRKPDKVEELTRDFEQLKSQSEKNENELKKLQESQVEMGRDFNNEKNKRLRLEKDLEEKITELGNSQKELKNFQELLRIAEEKFRNESKRVSELEGLCKSNKETGELLQAKNSQELSKLQEEIRRYQSEVKELNERLGGSSGKVLELKNELGKRMKTDEEILNRICTVVSSLSEAKPGLADTNALSNIDGVTRDKTNTTDAMECLSKKVEILKMSLKEEMSRANSLEQSLQTSSSTSCSNCEKRKSRDFSLAEELEEAKESHRKEMEILQESLKSESQILKSYAEELKLKLTSKVILLQSDISELNAKHDQELKQVKEQHKQEVASWQENHGHELKQTCERHQQEVGSWREKYESLNSSSNDEISSLRENVRQLEEQLLEESQSNERRIESLKKDYEAKARENEVNKNGVVSLSELEEVKEQHNKELQELQENHRKELEENKSDMMMVLQALKSDSYQSSSMSSESLEMNDELKKLERYVETLKKEHEQEIERLNVEHEQDLEQLRSDLVTLVRVQDTYKTSDEDKADPNGNIVDLDGQLVALKRSHEKEIREKEAQHQNEVDQLKSDMLVAIQAASAVGNIGSQASAAPKTSSDERVTELQQYIANMEREFEDERENLQNAIKKAESATRFGLRRNEEMSNKIYQMQREMEEIDAKYQKEIQLYKQAFDQEKNRKTTIGAVPGILAENESLKVKLQELELSMEQMQVRYDSEIKRYKEKFQQDNVLTVEELQLKIKSLEDTIEQMRLEHDTELERYTKAVKRGKVSLAGTAKERDLERKIDDLESKVDVMRQKHREETRKYRERLEDEMELHRKDVSESRAKLRKLEADSRQLEDLKNKVTELETKNGKLTKDTSKYKEQEVEFNEMKSKNRELQRQVDVLKRKLDKLEEATEENKETSNESILTSSRTKLSRYSSCDSIGLSSTARTKTQTIGDVDEARQNVDDIFEMNNNSGKSEIGGYKLNPGLKRPASVSAFPVLNENGSRRTTQNEKRRDSGSTSSRSTYQPSYMKTSTSASNIK